MKKGCKKDDFACICKSNGFEGQLFDCFEECAEEGLDGKFFQVHSAIRGWKILDRGEKSR